MNATQKSDASKPKGQPMNAIVFVSVLSALSSVPSAQKDTKPAPVSGVVVRSLIQGSGSVIIFEHASDMRGAK